VKNGKSSEPMNINLEIIKYGGRKVLVFETTLLSKILHKDSIPKRTENRLFDSDT
jgi:hypothetical protein